MKIDLENIGQFTIPLCDYKGNWIFRDENDKLASKEHQDQIMILNKDASKYLWDFEMGLNIDCSEKYFNQLSIFDCDYKNEKQIKKHLYNIGIPFGQLVFISMQPNLGFLLTWKMVIKYSHNLFSGCDQSVWDKTLNWRLEYHHDGLFTYGKDYIFDAQSAVSIRSTTSCFATKTA
ncbi:hypothetical protein JXM83_05435 [Candidatus Woesearchaeota archaeon]|nr:hypothetical protein [Candidatus Delongbacteria bacterium]MBN2881464.1 hypothetical protein [Candidatus Woesearchaeota archaeon]